MMIKPEQVPLEVWIALRDHVRERPYGYDYTEAIAAALNAWPRVLEQQFYELTADGKRITFPVIILPLTQEKTDDKA